MMIGGGTLGVLGVGGVAYTRGSVGTRWILSVHIGVALSWRHWTCVETKRDKWVCKVSRSAIYDRPDYRKV